MSQPIAFVTTRFKCPHCSRSRSSKRAMVEHIGRCWYHWMHLPPRHRPIVDAHLPESRSGDVYPLAVQ